MTYTKIEKLGISFNRLEELREIHLKLAGASLEIADFINNIIQDERLTQVERLFLVYVHTLAYYKSNDIVKELFKDGS